MRAFTRPWRFRAASIYLEIPLITITESHANEMVAHALEEDPNECCGILAGADGTGRKLYRIANSAKSPYRYLMDPQEFLNADLDSERSGMEFLAFYHSHTHSPAYPSPTDVRMAQQSGYHDVYYILVSLEDSENPAIKAYLIRESGEIVEQPLEVK